MHIDEHSTEIIQILYKFQAEDGTEKEFETILDGKTLGLRNAASPHLPEWTRLAFNQCENCPLGAEVERCPVAANLSGLIETFKFSTSYETVFAVVETPDRSYAKQTTVQNALSSLMGIYMVTSNCPILDKLRPMVRFHLPFASATETVYRSVTMYLLAQFFKKQRGKKPDWELDRLVEIYKEISKVNKGMWNRLSAASSFDANVNALIVLNTFGDALRFSIKKGLDDLEKLFGEYMEEE
ncbi:MAG TPA: hypothetical protein VI758_00150 [Bacteroidota bacterium]